MPSILSTGSCNLKVKIFTSNYLRLHFVAFESEIIRYFIGFIYFVFYFQV